VAGIAIARVTDVWFIFLAIALLSVGLIIRWRSPLLIALLGIGLGGLRQEWAETRPITPLSNILEGTVDGPPNVYSAGSPRSLADPSHSPLEEVDPSEIDPVPLRNGSFVIGRVQVRFFRKPIDLLGGERVRVHGKMKRPAHATNPGQFDYGAYLEHDGIDAVMMLEGSPEVLEGPPWWSRTRAWLRGLYDRGPRPEVGALLSALVLGRRESVPEDLVKNLQRSGTAHLLAISGQNLVLVLVSFWAILVLLGIHGRILSLLLLVILGLYTLLTGLQVSVVRSYLMMACYFGADLAWRRRDSLTALAAAALAICAIDPMQVVDVGFQLSFLAVLGLSFISPIFMNFTQTGGWFWNKLRMALGVSAAAWLATAPVVLADFNLLTPGIILGNLVIVPLMSVEFMIGLAHAALASLGAGAVTGWAANVVFDITRWVSTAVTSIPLAYLYAPPAGAGLIALYYAGLAAWTWWCRSTRERWWKPVCAALIVAPLGFTSLRHRPHAEPFLAVLDVGRGSCAYLEWPDGRNLMVDCGSLNSRDPGASIAAPYLWYRGVTQLDTLALTHTDADHVNGARSMIELFKVRHLWVTHAFDGQTWPPGVEVRVIERVGDPIRAGEIEILGPPVWEKFGRKVPVNETSIVLRAAGVLFPGDIMDRGAEELMTLPDIRARALVMPHHGKWFHLHSDFVRRVGPETILVSAPEGYYSEKVILALPVLPRITGQEGAIEIRLK
jgi:competence protein ComEC